MIKIQYNDNWPIEIVFLIMNSVVILSHAFVLELSTVICPFFYQQVVCPLAHAHCISSQTSNFSTFMWGPVLAEVMVG